MNGSQLHINNDFFVQIQDLKDKHKARVEELTQEHQDMLGEKSRELAALKNQVQVQQKRLYEESLAMKLQIK